MLRRKWTFDQIVYTVFALPTLFFTSYFVSIFVGGIAVAFLIKRLRLYRFDAYEDVSAYLGEDSFGIIVAALLAIVPAVVMTRKFFISGWPADRTAKDATTDKQGQKDNDGVKNLN